MDEIKELTKAEEQIMHELWEMEGGFVKDVLDRLPEPKPAYNTVSTIIRILQTKGFVNHRAYGKSHKYIPAISKEDYKKVVAEKLLSGYFENSPKQMLSFFLEEKKLDVKDLDDIMNIIQKHK